MYTAIAIDYNKDLRDLLNHFNTFKLKLKGYFQVTCYPNIITDSHRHTGLVSG